MQKGHQRSHDVKVFDDTKMGRKAGTKSEDI